VHYQCWRWQKTSQRNISFSDKLFSVLPILKFPIYFHRPTHFLPLIT